MEFNWSKIEVGSVTMYNHSTSSIIEVVTAPNNEEEGEEHSYYTYAEFEDLAKAIEETK